MQGALNFNMYALMPSTPADFLTSNVDKNGMFGDKRYFKHVIWQQLSLNKMC